MFQTTDVPAVTGSSAPALAPAPANANNKPMLQMLQQPQTEAKTEQKNKQKYDGFEWVLLVPPKLAKIAYALLVKHSCVPRPWHDQGRFGSRTHKHTFTTEEARCTTTNSTNSSGSSTEAECTSTAKIAIPIISKDLVLNQAKQQKKSIKDEAIPEGTTTGTPAELNLYHLIHNIKGVEFLWKQVVQSPRALARTVPVFDATIHPERKPKEIEQIQIETQTQRQTKKNKQERNGNNKFTYVDLFAGIGGFAVALEKLGGTCILASEIESSCQRVYQTNFTTAPMHGDIYQISNEDLTKLRQKHDNNITILVGGFPCQPFSALGSQPGLTCPKGNLFLEIVRFLKILKPKSFLLENVPGLLDVDHGKTFKVILKALEEDAGYNVSYEVLNARGLTATSRKRLFLVGFQRQQEQEQHQQSLSNTETITQQSSNESSSGFLFPYIPDLGLRAKDVIVYDDLELTEIERVLLPITDHQLEQLNTGKKWRPAHLAWNNTTLSTLVSHYGNSINRGHSQLVPSPIFKNPRRFSPRECLRIMGFPNEYQLPPKSTNDGHCCYCSTTADDACGCCQNTQVQGDMAFIKEQYRMIGNAVCPPLIAAIAGAIMKYLWATMDDQCAEDWQVFGRDVAIELAYAATVSGVKSQK